MAVCGGALMSLPVPARAQSYPLRTVRVVLGFPAGGTTDVVARMLSQWLSERLGATFIVENRPGAATNIATEAVIRAPADGHTLLVCTPANAINASFYNDLPFVFMRDIVPIIGLIRSPYVLEVIPTLPARTVPELVAYAKENPGKLSIGSFGTGTGSHLCGEMFKMMAGFEMNHVPYRGSAPMLTDLLGGRVHLAFDNLPASIEHIMGGGLRALAVTTSERSKALPDVQALAEFYPGYEASSWLAVGVRSGTPADIIETLHQEIAACLADDRMKAKLERLGATVLGGSSAETATLIADETEKWRKVVTFSATNPN